MPRRHHLIGSGPASVTAAETIRAVDPTAEILIVGAERYGYYSRPGLAYYLANEVPERGLFPFSGKDFSTLGIGFMNGRAIGVDTAAHRVTLEDGQVLPYDRLLLATGAWAIPIGVPGAELDGVAKLDDMHDARDLIARSRTAKAAVVVGGGITALEIVEGLCARNVHVHYLMRKDRYWGNVLSESESRIVEQGLRDRGVEIHTFTEVGRIIGERGRVTAIETAKGEHIPCDLVAVAIGVLPQKGLAEEAGIVCGRGVLVDEHLQSSAPDVFAAGDVAEVTDTRTGRGTVEVLWSSAIAKGRVAGLNMAGEAVHVYDATAPLNVTRLAGFKITIMGTVGSGKDSDVQGIVRGDSETWRQLGETPIVETQLSGAHVRLALGENSIAGAVVMGDQALSFPLQEMIGGRVDVSAIVPRLTTPSAPVDDLIEDFWRDWKEHGVHTD
jgi:NADPH-dependent 2,4-dienoyl-CoA reductase/sulfur reductase-like enzyme